LVVEQAFAGQLQTNYTPDLIPEDILGPDAISRYIAEDYDIIVGTSVGFSNELQKAA
jgi:hypothetical protein